MNPIKVAFIDEVHSILEERLKAKKIFICLDFTKLSKEEILNQIEDIDGIVIRSRFTMNEDFLKGAKQIKFIARSGAGLENIDTIYCEKRNIELFNAPEGNRNAVGEHALGMILALFNRLCIANNEVKNGIWKREENRGEELDGKTVGIIGYGNNGSAFAQKLKGFDVKVLAYDKYKTGFSDGFVKEASLNEIFEQVDLLSFHIPQNDETLFIGNSTFFNSFKKPFYLINLSRGKIVKTEDLVLAIKENKILGACLDVLEYEKKSFENMFDSQVEKLPEAFKFILKSEKTLISPHVGGWTNQSYVKLSEILADKILKLYNI